MHFHHCHCAVLHYKEGNLPVSTKKALNNQTDISGAYFSFFFFLLAQLICVSFYLQISYCMLGIGRTTWIQLTINLCTYASLVWFFFLSYPFKCDPIWFICARYMPLSGFHGVLSGFLVGIKQMIPDQELPLLKIKAKVWTLEINF